jgi:hypothetical protein
MKSVHLATKRTEALSIAEAVPGVSASYSTGCERRNSDRKREGRRGRDHLSLGRDRARHRHRDRDTQRQRKTETERETVNRKRENREKSSVKTRKKNVTVFSLCLPVPSLLAPLCLHTHASPLTFRLSKR